MSNCCLAYRFFLTRAIVPGILFWLMLASSCTNSMNEINEAMGKAKVGEDRGKDVTILYSRNGHVTARLFAHTFLRNERTDPTYAEMRDGLKVDFFDDSLHIKSTITAGYARWYERQNNILLRDSVHIVNDKGEQLKTQELVWNQKIQKFFTEKPVQIITPTQILYGTGMEASQDFTNYHINNLSGSVTVEKSKLPEG